MHRINDAIICNGKLVLSDLPFANGQHVQVIVNEQDAELSTRKSIAEVRAMLRGGVERYDDPFAPAIPPDDWDLNK